MCDDVDVHNNNNNKINAEGNIWLKHHWDPDLEWVQPEAGCPHLHPCRPATSWGRPDWWRGGCLLSGRKSPAPDTAQRGRHRGRSQSKLEREPEERMFYYMKVGDVHMLSHTH